MPEVLEAIKPYARVYVNTGEPIVEEDLLEFRLLYQGLLPSSGNSSSKAADKHRIRNSLHYQLRRLWDVNQSLQSYASSIAVEEAERNGPVRAISDLPFSNVKEKVEYGIKALGKIWNRGGIDFVPIVSEKQSLRCSIDVMLLRPEEDRYIFERGDMDGQLKTLFDALTLPVNTYGLNPAHDINPMFVLLSDDKLVSEVRVFGDQLLMLPGATEIKANEVFAVIHVKINHKFPGRAGNYFG